MDPVKHLKTLGIPDAEIVGQKAGKQVIRAYTNKGWVYLKVDGDASVDAFAATVKRPPTSRSNLKSGK